MSDTIAAMLSKRTWVSILIWAMLCSNTSWALDTLAHMTVTDTLHHDAMPIALDDVNSPSDHVANGSEHDHGCHAQIHLLGMAALNSGFICSAAGELNTSHSTVFQSITSPLPTKPPRI